MNDWSAISKDILSELQRGKHIAMLSVHPSSLVFSEHARMYFENAKHLCVGSASDFNVWGVLYGIRHGLELWLKCLIRNRIIDRFLESVFFFPSRSFDELVGRMEMNRKLKSSFQKIICMMRNCFVDGMTYPECWNKCMENHWVDKGLVWIRSNGALDRNYFACHWSGNPSSTHDLKKLWDEEGAVDECQQLFDAVHSYPNDYAMDIATPSRIKNLCSFFHDIDSGGDVFRYPISLRGDYHSELPNFSMSALEHLAEELIVSTVAYQSFRQDVYNLGVLSSPRLNEFR